MNGTTLLGTLLCTACALGGAAATFTGAAGDHLLSTSGNWSGGLPGPADEARIGPAAPPGQYATEADLATGAFVFSPGSDAPFVFALGAHAWTAKSWQTDARGHLTLDGGTWTVDGDANVGRAGGDASFVCLTNGATLTAAGRTSVGWDGNGHTLLVSGAGSRWTATSTVQGHVGNTRNSKGNAILVNDGGAFETASNPFNIGQDGRGGVFCVASGATATFANNVNLGRANDDAVAPEKGENRLVAAGGHVTLKWNLYVGGRPCAPSNRVVVTAGGTLDAQKIELGSGTPKEGMRVGSSFNTLDVSDGGAVTAAVWIAAAGREGADAPRGNVFTVGTNGSFCARGPMLYVGRAGVGNGMRVLSAAAFDASAASTLIGEEAWSTNNYLEASDTDTMTFKDLSCGLHGGGCRATFTHVTNLVVENLFRCGVWGSNNTVTVMGTRRLEARTLSCGHAGGSGNRMTLGVSEALEVPDGGIYVGYGAEAAQAGDTHASDDCHIRIVGCGEGRLAFNPLKKLNVGSWGAGCSFTLDHIEMHLQSVTFPEPPPGRLAAFTYAIGGNSLVESAGNLNVVSSNGLRVVVRGKGTQWTHGHEGVNDGYVNVGTRAANNHFAVEDGATMFCGDSTMALGDAGASSLTVGDGATLSLYRFRVNGSTNAVVISNGTLVVREEFSFPSTLSSVVRRAEGNRLAFHGAQPRLEFRRAGRSVMLGANVHGDSPKRDTTLFFDVPEDGWTQPAVEASGTDGEIVIAKTTRLEADVKAFSAAGGGGVMLMRAAKRVAVDDLDELGAALPSGSFLQLRNSGRELWLRVPNTGGTLLLVR